MTMTGTKYPATVRAPSADMLKPGRKNRKLGGRVAVGKLAGTAIYGLSLEERRSCPRSCVMWDACYGNNMPFALRYDHTAPEFMDLLGKQIAVLTANKPLLVRLHVLGDFFSPDYVRFWGGLLAQHPSLSVYGYTAHAPDSPIGQALHGMTLDHGWSRAAIRFSGYAGPYRGAVVADEAPPGTFTCPEQEGRVMNCASCGACWEGEKSVHFMPH